MVDMVLRMMKPSKVLKNRLAVEIKVRKDEGRAQSLFWSMLKTQPTKMGLLECVLS